MKFLSLKFCDPSLLEIIISLGQREKLKDPCIFYSKGWKMMWTYFIGTRWEPLTLNFYPVLRTETCSIWQMLQPKENRIATVDWSGVIWCTALELILSLESEIMSFIGTKKKSDWIVFSEQKFPIKINFEPAAARFKFQANISSLL